MKKNSISDFPFIERVFSYLFGDINVLESETRRTQSAENRVAISLLSKEDLGQTESVIWRIGGKNICLIHSHEILEFYFLLFKTFSIFVEDWKFPFEEFSAFCKRRKLEQNRPWCFSNTEVVSDTYFLEYFERRLSHEKERIHFIRVMKSTMRCKDGEYHTFAEIFKQALILKFNRVPKGQPKRLIRHKGYRDHGSLRLNVLPAWLNRTVLTSEEYQKVLAKQEEERALNLYFQPKA